MITGIHGFHPESTLPKTCAPRHRPPEHVRWLLSFARPGVPLLVANITRWPHLLLELQNFFQSLLFPFTPNTFDGTFAFSSAKAHRNDYELKVCSFALSYSVKSPHGQNATLQSQVTSIAREGQTETFSKKTCGSYRHGSHSKRPVFVKPFWGLTSHNFCDVVSLDTAPLGNAK